VEYFVVGTDGRRYGPADSGTLIRWAREGRIARSTTLIDCHSGSAHRAGDLAELAGSFAPARGSIRVDRSEPRRPEPVRVRRASRHDGRDAPPEIEGGFFDIIGPKNKVAAGLLAILLPGLGLHRFYMGFPFIALLQIATTPLCGIGAVWCVIEGVLCLMGRMRDAQGRLLRD